MWKKGSCKKARVAIVYVNAANKIVQKAQAAVSM